MYFNLGQYEELEVKNFCDFGLYLKKISSNDEEEILLPNKEVTDDISKGDILNVFIYKDFKDRWTATLRKPHIILGEVKSLEVSDINEVGAFLDWGLDKELLLPYDEQTIEIEEGNSYLVMLQIDELDRLYATMKIYQNLRTDHDYELNQEVPITVYNKNEDLGVFVAVDGQYHGLILKHDIHQQLNIGDTLTGRVAQIAPDGKITISLKKEITEQMDLDSSKIYNRLLESENNQLMYNDKSDPKAIKKEFKMSKRAFKRAIGRLYKEKKIEFIDNGIKLIK